MDYIGSNILERMVVDADEALELLDTFENDCIHATCHRIALIGLFSKQLVCKYVKPTSNGDNRPSEQLLTAYMNKYFLEQAIDSLAPYFACGYTVYTKVMETDPLFGGKNVKPQLIPRHMFKVEKITYKDYSMEWIATANTSSTLPGQRDRGVPMFISFFPGCKPGPSYSDGKVGKHRSIVSPTMKHSAYIHQMYKEQMAALKQLSHPPILIQQAPQLMTHVQTQQQMSRGDARIIQSDQDRQQFETEERITGLVNATSINRISRPADSSLNDAYLTDPHGRSGAKKKFYNTPEDNMHFVPDGFVLGPQPPLPGLFDKLLDFDFVRQNHIISLYRFPASIVLSAAKNTSSSNNSAVDDNEIILLQRTLGDLQQVICNLLLQMYLDCYPPPDGIPDISIELPLIPFLSPTNIQLLVDRNVIPTQVGKDYQVAIGGLRPSDKLDGENTHDVPPAGLNENATTGLLTAKQQLMNTEKLKLLAEIEKLKAETKVIKEGEPGENPELVEKEKELAEMEIDGELQIMDKKLELEEFKLDATLQTMDKQMQVNKTTPKPSSGGGR